MLYDVTSAMVGCILGLAKLIMDEEPHTIYTHCYSYVLNLIVGDAVKGCAVMKDALDVTHEVTQLLATLFTKI